MVKAKKTPIEVAGAQRFAIGRPPEYTLKAKMPMGPYRKVGAAWVNEDGSISLKLSAFVSIEEIHNPTLILYPGNKE